MSQLQELVRLVASGMLAQPGVTVFTGPTYPLLFFSLLYARLKSQHSVYSIDRTAGALPELLACLSSSFLGAQHIYFLKNLSSSVARERDVWISFCNTYTGPQALVCFCLKEDFKLFTNTNLRRVELPSEISREEYVMLVALFFPYIKRSDIFAQSLYSRRKTVPLDTACLLAYYQITLGRSVEQFFDTWSAAIIGRQESLFMLSQHFFSKNAPAFLALWTTFYQDFPPEFWIAYWSEQLWQAGIFLHYAQKKSILEGRKYVSRLPFMFLQRDWQRYDFSELVEAHQFLYMLDYHLKNGAHEYNLELFYLKFLSNTFASPSIR